MPDRATELGAFLRRSRERLDPDDYGLPSRRRRRTPGLRREELAELAGVSSDYVVRLEQARSGLHPSTDVVTALADALRLEPTERAYLFGLAQQRPRRPDKPTASASPSLVGLVTDLAPLPAAVLNRAFDVLAWNGEMAALFLVDLEDLPPRQRNLVWLCLLHPRVRKFYPDREAVVRDAVTHLRRAWAAHPEDEVLRDLVGELLGADDDFARQWSAPDTDLVTQGPKLVHHPVAGELTLRADMLSTTDHPDQSLLLYRTA